MNATLVTNSPLTLKAEERLVAIASRKLTDFFGSLLGEDTLGEGW